MNRKRNYLTIGLLVVFSVLTINAYSQIANVNQVGGQPIMMKKYEKVEGSPYIGSGKWFPGKFFVRDGNTINGVMVRYNAYDDNLEFQREGKSPLIIDSKILDGFEFGMIPEGSDKTVSYNFKKGDLIGSNDLKADGFYRIIYEGEFKIYQKLKVNQISVTPPDYGQSAYDKFVQSEDYFFIDGDGNLDDFKLNRGNFYSKFQAKKKDIKAYLKKKSVDFDDATDVAQLSAYIESLL
ncbi:hypothetical protein [Marinoscillum sp.]|uniref:hypothetical protein n=1 Tax=Marinoscillum sp. TaxID=2024838 RepID=UPI003BAA48E7